MNHPVEDESQWELSDNDPERNTMIWSFGKQKWYIGPELPKEMQKIDNFGSVCAIAANSSTAFIFYKDYVSYTENTEFGWYDYNFSYNFHTKAGKHNTKPPPTIYPYFSAFISSCAISQSKTYQR